MEYRTLGRTGLRVSAVALGCEGFMHKRAEEVKADFDFAIGHGINFVDIYSSNPDLRADIGAALEGRRGEFIIQGHLCTVWENDQYLRTRDPQKSADSFERQLRQLRTDYLDVGMIHYVDAEADLRAQSVPFAEAFGTFATLEEAVGRLETLRALQLQVDRNAYLKACGKPLWK